MSLYIHGLLTAKKYYQPTIKLRSLGQNRLTVPTTLNRFILASRAFKAMHLKFGMTCQHLRDMHRIFGAQRAV